MNNLSNSMKKLMGNKNTVTIIGIVLCIVILYVGYNMRINEKVKLTRIPYAAQTIQPKTKITAEMIQYMNVPADFLRGGYYSNEKDIIGKYSNYNTVIAEGSIFYTSLVTEKDNFPDSAFMDLTPDYTPINYKVNMDSTYANSMMPKSYVNIYFKSLDDEGKIMYAKFISNIKILAIKDSSGKHVFENTEEERTPAYMQFGLPEDFHLLFRKALYLEKTSDVEISLVPSTDKVSEKDKEKVNEEIKKFIEERTKNVDIKTILSETADKVTQEETTDEQNQNTQTNQ